MQTISYMHYSSAFYHTAVVLCEQRKESYHHGKSEGKGEGFDDTKVYVESLDSHSRRNEACERCVARHIVVT